MDAHTIREKLHHFITHELMRDPDYVIDDIEPIPNVLIDSFSLARIGVYAEDEFGVYIPDPDLTVAKMNTLEQMVARILRDLK